jgi:hypothetical protein
LRNNVYAEHLRFRAREGALVGVVGKEAISPRRD